MRSVAIRVASAIAVTVAASACAERHSSAVSDCRGPSSDSASAACIAVDTVARASGIPSRVLSAERTTNGGFRIRTVPAGENTLDGMGLVLTDRAGRVIRVTLGDSL